MSLNATKIVIVGAGIAGLAVARALALRGADVTVLEQAEKIREFGGGLQISPNGFVVLQALGLGSAVSDRSIRAEAVSLRDYRKGEVVRLDLSQLARPSYHFVHRGDLIQILAESARSAGARIRLLQKVEAVTPGQPARVTLASGASLEADYVIGADGLHSSTRAALNETGKPHFTGQVAWRAIVKVEHPMPPVVRVFMAPHRHMVVYPLRDGCSLNVVAVQERAAWVAESWTLRDDPDSLRAAFGDFGAEAQEILHRIDEVYLWGLFRHPVAATWCRDGVAILGDAAHPTLPFLAQGANMALEDAWVLADVLAQGEALDSYQDRRRDRAVRVIKAANGNAWKYHLSAPPLRWAAHFALRTAGSLAPGALLGQFDWLYEYDVTKSD